MAHKRLRKGYVTPSVSVMPEESVLAALKMIGSQFFTVTFVKKDGTVTSKNGRLKATSRLVGNERGVVQGERMRDNGQVWLALGPKDKSASFCLDRVTAIKAKGIDLAARAE